MYELNSFSDYSLAISLLGVAIAFLVVRSKIRTHVRSIGVKKNIAPRRIKYVYLFMVFIWGLICVAISSVFIGFSYSDIGITLIAFISLLLVILFANWSIMSNMTASVIVFFFFPYRVGDSVKVIDGEKSIAGVIEEMTMFHVILRSEGGKKITYPSVMVFSKAIEIDKSHSVKVYE